MIDIGQLDILSILIFFPLVGALVLAFIPGHRIKEIRYTALLVSVGALVISLVLALAFDNGQSGFQFVQETSWIGFFGIEYKVGVDGISLAMVVLTTLLTMISILASFGPIKTRVKEYMIAFLVLEVGILGVFLALDLFLFYIFWEIVLVPMYMIIGIWGGANRIYATMKFVIYTLVGSLLMLVAILALAWSYLQETGTWVGAFDYQQLLAFDIDPTGFVVLDVGAST
ncbi:MAG: NuoM family protein, partial [Chloroflexota bacterium]